MNTSQKTSDILQLVKKHFGISITKTHIPPQGMDSDVVFIEDGYGKEYAVKSGRGVISDIKAYELLKKSDVQVPVPDILGHISTDTAHILVMERIPFPLLESIPADQIAKYIPAMVKALQAVHRVHSDRVGTITNSHNNQSWKDYFLSRFNGKDTSFSWPEIAARTGLDEQLVLSSVTSLVNVFEDIDFLEGPYSLLHTDVNQRNILVNPDTDEVTGVIDWGEAMYGDPVYDFSRIRMLIWHYNLGKEAVDAYYALMNYSPEQRHLDDLYWVSRVIEYLAYYSEERNPFNTGRIKLHQDFLRSYQWKR